MILGTGGRIGALEVSLEAGCEVYKVHKFDWLKSQLKFVTVKEFDWLKSSEVFKKSFRNNSFKIFEIGVFGQ